MKKNFFKISLTLNIIFAVIAAVFLFIFNYYITRYQGYAFTTFLSYTKLFFDLMALFIGYSAIIFAFSKLDIKNGYLSLLAFFASVFISFLVQVISECVYFSTGLTVKAVVASIYLAAGSCFINQLIPAILIALLTYLLTNKCKDPVLTKFISWSCPVQKTMMIVSIVLCVINVITITAIDLFPLLIQNKFSFYKQDLIDIITGFTADYIITILFYLVLQYVVYYWMYKFYCSYLKKTA